MLLGGLRLNLFTGINLNQGFRSGAVLLLCLHPHGAAKNVRSLIERSGSAKTALAPLGIANLMRIVEVVTTNAHLRFEPSGTAFLARKQRTVRTHHFGSVARS